MRAVFGRLFVGFCAIAATALPLASAQPVVGESGTPVGDIIRPIFDQVVLASLIIGVLVEALLVYALVRFRHRKGDGRKAPQHHGNTRLEIAWTIAPALVMAWLLVISYNGLRGIDEIPEPDFTVEVIGQQWFWTFIYPDGTTVTNGTLRVEQGRTVELRVTALDVVHAFRVAELDVMIDANPGVENRAWFLARDSGEYNAQCYQFCGLAHGEMRATVVVFPAGTQETPYGFPPPPEPEPSEEMPPVDPNATQPGNESNITADEVIDVTLQDFRFNPGDYELEPGRVVEFRITNADSVPHNMYVGTFAEAPAERQPDWNSTDIAAGGTASLIVELPDEPIAYDVWCNVPGHAVPAGMVTSLSAGGAATDGVAQADPLLPGPGALALLVALLGGAWLRQRSGSKR